MIKKEDFFLFKKNESNDILVVFSAATVPIGKFSFSNQFKDANLNILYLNCPENTWYLKSPLGKNDGIKYYNNIVENIIKEYNLKGTKIALGGSMGAYGALLVGTALNFDRIICTGIETELFLENSNSKKYFLKKKGLEIPDLNNLICCSSFKEAIFIFGERDIIDIFSAAKINHDDRIKIIPLKNHTHSIPPVLMNKFELSDLFLTNNLIEKIESSFEIGDSIVNSNLNEIEILYRLMMEYHMSILKNHTKAQAIGVFENTKSRSIKSLVACWLGKSLALINPSESIYFLMQSIKYNLHLSESYPELVRLLRKENIEESLKYSSLVDTLHSPDILDSSIELLYEHAVNLYLTKNFEYTIKYMNYFLEYRPNHHHAKLLLGESLLEIGELNQGLEILESIYSKSNNNQKNRIEEIKARFK
ncbi:hypothetical protein KO488_04775 [Poseidonibacter lekithochrous]|uniref:tetratricopeptide repeat protein n=1 Tax=Poseidonibacter TaxID=2321187 RepID=UPI001C088E92|nr:MULTISPECIES: hypothetical protein [Poseidonibacter]MBU3014060.1 hypothetical protein [Poseidonibacter lekithochrous]MDO6827357.1 hypothetical protein [Poseidonibacter sp. 1_MG-2023]